MRHSISMVVSVFNSEKTLLELNHRLIKVLERHSSEYEILLIDDGSIDNSFDKMCDIHKNNNRIKVVQLDGNFGQQNAIMCGLQYAKGDYIGTIDDDLQHPPEELEKLILELEKGYDIVYGIPVKKKHSLFRNIGTIMTDQLFNIVCLKPVKVKISSFRIMKKELVQKIIKDETPFIYISAIVFKNKALVANVPVKHDMRKIGSSNYNLSKLFNLYFKILKNYSILSFIGRKKSYERFIVKKAYL